MNCSENPKLLVTKRIRKYNHKPLHSICANRIEAFRHPPVYERSRWDYVDRSVYDGRSRRTCAITRASRPADTGLHRRNSGRLVLSRRDPCRGRGPRGRRRRFYETDDSPTLPLKGRANRSVSPARARVKFPGAGEPSERIIGAFDVLATFLDGTQYRGCPYIIFTLHAGRDFANSRWPQ